MSLPEAPLSQLTDQWLAWDKDPETREVIQKLKDENNEKELERRLRRRIKFGTAGLRAEMSAGFAFMNSLTVIQTSQGLARWLKKRDPENLKKGVVVGMDARNNSVKYAHHVVNAFLAEGFKVYFHTVLTNTPFVSWSTKYFGAAAGVMITASHNPPMDNGYKVYLSGGTQLKSPEDAEISQSIKGNLEPWPEAWREVKPELADENPLFINKAYYIAIGTWVEEIRRFALSTVPELIMPSFFMYTPLHGVGGIVLPHIMHQIGIGKRMLSVTKQMEPDGNFPTTPKPNPEEQGTLDKAMFAAQDCARELIIANDPDADRLAIAQVVPGRGSWYTFTGNQIGVLLASHILESLKQPCPKKGYVVLSTTVSSSMLEKMARAYGVEFRETLTGFKWMGNLAKQLEDDGYIVPFAYEEALGYMFPQICYDKDGITAASIFLLAEAQWRAQGLTPLEKLQKLFERFGHHETLNSYVVSPDPDTTAKLFRKIREGPWGKGKTFGKFKILRWRDLTVGYDSDTPNNVPELPTDPNTHMITLWLEKDVKFTLRASGTEPKVKFYIECCNPVQDDAIAIVCEVLDTIILEWVHPFTPEMDWANEFFTSSSVPHKVPVQSEGAKK